tara:strand:- start:2088 stop:3134 length:1047 start_codon:yes stop_codon:yes gene_type:complete
VILRSAKREYGTIIVASLMLMFLLPYLVNTYTLTVILIYGMLGTSLGLIWGFGGILCFGQAAFFGLGAYTYAVSSINFGESTGAMLLSIVIPAAFAFCLGLVIFYGRLNDVYLGVMTLVVTLILFKFINSTAGPQYIIGKAKLGGFNGIPRFHTLNVPGRPEDYIYGDSLYYFVACALIIVFVLVTALLRSSFGRIAVGIRENETRIGLMGYDSRSRKTILFSIGAAIAGLAGALFANWGEIVTPGLFSLRQSAEIIIWCIVGGLGTRIGPIVGAAALTYLKYGLGQQSIVDNALVFGVILIFFVLFLPKGLVPWAVSVWHSVFQRKFVRRPHNRRYRSSRPDLSREI